MKLPISFLLIIFLSGCRTERSGDSARENSGNQSLNENSASRKNKGNFYDFFYQFLSNENYRRSRVADKEMLKSLVLPEADFTVHIYPFDSVDSREFEEDLSRKKVYSVISASKNEVTNYNFLKEKDKWFLASFDTEKLNMSDDKKFINFILKFSKDTLYQKKHIRYPLKSSFLDYDNDYADTTVYLPSNEVYAKNFLINDYLPFLHEGEILSSEFFNATVYFRGNRNGIYIECTFKFIDGQWFMVEEKDFST
ncbi:MAG TPA: DUF4348 domain-containing protein [Ignavibacteriaceae bacterium]|nr:DUF4348 domain-containing protein [Ignavibacteriaceae bacterium]